LHQGPQMPGNLFPAKELRIRISQTKLSINSLKRFDNIKLYIVHPHLAKHIAYKD
jgi:hypothetical protein